MIPLLSREAVRAVDRHAIEQLGIPGIVLMENAGRGAFEAIAARFPGALERVVLVGGPGQNGGDAWVVTRLLNNRGYRPRPVLLGDPARLKGDAAANYAALAKLGIAVEVVTGDDLAALQARLHDASLVVDGIFGTGLDRAVAGRKARAIELINQSPVPTVALDLPSGVDADSGQVLGCAVAAALTVTFAAHKLGLHQHPATALCGELLCASIGVPGPRSEAGLLEASDVAAWLPARATDAHKGGAGHVMVVAGGPGRTGAALLSGLGALRGGAGLVTLCARAAVRAALDGRVPELMTEALPDDGPPALAAALRLSQGKAAAVVGPGLGLDADARELARRLALELPLPTVLDADALTALGTDYGCLRGAAGPRVLTPHPGEAGRLLGCGSGEVQAGRYRAARSLAEHSGAVVLLKGARTVVAEPGGRLAVNPTGTPAMGVAGAGDVLSGVAAALLGALPPFEACCAAAYLHGLAGELAAQADRGLLVSELAAQLPQALTRCRA